ncbi:MAG: TRAP transporter large permease subunit, partial [Alphaproteobacteria bacterium]
LSKIQFTPLIAILCMVAVLLFLGCFIDQVSMMLLTLPFFMPLATALNIDLIHLGVVFLISMQVGLLTPPFGLLLFVMKGVAPPEVRMTQVYSSIVPYVILTMLELALVVYYPPVATFLPRALL